MRCTVTTTFTITTALPGHHGAHSVTTAFTIEVVTGRVKRPTAPDRNLAFSAFGC
jgi:hypothetical protein